MKYKLIISIVAGVCCFFLSPYGAYGEIGDIVIDIPWAIILPFIVSLAFGWKYALIVSLSGGAVYPFYLWYNNGYACLLTSLIYTLTFVLIGLINGKSFSERISNFNLRALIISLIVISIYYIQYEYLFELSLSLNPSFWNSDSINFIDKEIIRSFFIKDSINFLMILLFSTTMIKVPLVQKIFLIKTSEISKDNSLIFVLSIISGCVIWLLFYFLSSSLVKINVNEHNQYITLALYIIVFSSLLFSRIIMEYSERNHKNIKAIAENESLLNTVFNTIPDLVWVKDPNGVYLKLNRRFEMFFGKNGNEILGKTDYEIVNKEQAELFRVNDLYALKSDEPVISEEEVSIKTDNRKEIFETIKAPLKVNNEVIGVLGIGRNITARKHYEENLRLAKIKAEESVKYTQLLFNSSPIGLALAKLTGELVEVNQAYTEIIGYSNLEALKLSYWDITPEKYKDQEEEILKNLTKKGFYGPYEKEYIHKSGKLVSVRQQGKIIEREGNKYIWSSVEDITDQKEADLKLAKQNKELLIAKQKAEESERNFTNFFNSSRDGYVICLGTGEILNPNPAYMKMLGYTIDEIYNESWKNNAPRMLLDWEIETYGAKLIEKGYTDLYEKEFTRKDGSVFPAQVQAFLMNDAQCIEEALMGIFIRDITKDKQSEEIIVRSSKLESLGTLAGGIAHDFNNLLSGIFGNIELAKYKTNDKSIMRFLDLGIDSIERARGLTNQLITFSKGGEPIKKIEQLYGFLKEIVQFSLSGSKVICHFDIDSDLLPSNVDRNQIAQVIDNLIINSVQAMPDGGNIYFSAKNIILGESELIGLKEGAYVKVTVVDEGIGIPKEQLTKIFDPFFTTKKTGYGIGLSTVHSIIMRHEGSIVVDSTVGEGTTFTLYLPAVNEDVISTEAVETNEHKGTGVIVVLEDELSIQLVLEEMLTEFGYTVVTKSNGEDVIDFVQEEIKAGREIAGMLFDITIPGGLGGKEIITEIRKLKKDTPAIVMSGYSDDPIMSDPTQFGFTSSLAKPFNMNDFILVLNKYVSKAEK